MQFGLIMDGPHYGPIAGIAALFIACALIILICLTVFTLIRYKGLCSGIQLLVKPILTQLKAGKLEPDTLSWSGITTPRFFAIAEALRQELSSQRPIAVIESLNKAFDLFAGPFRQMIYYMRVLGWGSCLVSCLGALSHAFGVFAGMAIVNAVENNIAFLAPVASMIAEAIRLQIYGLFVCLACLAVSSFSRSRLTHLLQGAVNV